MLALEPDPDDGGSAIARPELSVVLPVLDEVYLIGIWLAGARPIGTRPLLAFGVLAVLVGVQFFAIGLLSELLLSYQTRTDDVSIRRRLG